QLGDSGIRVSLFIAPDLRQIEAASRLRAPAIEIHVGPWCEALSEGDMREAEAEWLRIVAGAEAAHGLGLEVHAGHGLEYATAATISGVPEIVELNIGHYLVGEAIFVGLGASVRRMRASMDKGRAALRQSDTAAASSEA
ncbi:MAG TPA: pyridoxine 5'-phosphate synthase, partial [Methyloceanibacter sp.]|nr:pyridoxine 5'-phosphate synthase [Methyloceanibacter sp.]